MTNWLVGQLDYIFFFYGLALLLLGTVCVSITRSGPLGTPWWLMGCFALGHGVADWLRVLALVVGDSGPFTLLRELLVVASYACLLEFARRTQRIIGTQAPGPWIHAALGTALLATTLAAGSAHFLSASRLLVALPALGWTAGLFAVAAARTEELKGNPRSRLARIWSATSFGAFAVASGIIVPRTPFLPEAWPSAEAFLAWTGVPIQLVRALLVCGMALSIWALAVSFDRKGSVLRKKRLLFWVMASSLGALLAGGWLFTDWLGRLHEQDLRSEAASSASQVHDHLMDQMQGVDGAARTVASMLGRLPAGDLPRDQARLDDLVDAVALASEGWVVYVLDPTGTTVAASNRGRPDSFLGKNFAARPYFQAAIAGKPGQLIALGLVSRVPGYFSSEPVRDAAGGVVAVAVVKLNLTPEQLGPQLIDEAFLVSPEGRALVATGPGQAGRLLWRHPEAAASPAPVGTVRTVEPAILDHVVAEVEWLAVAGQRKLATRVPLPVSDWSLVVLKVEQFRVANRVLGIIITLLLAAVMLAYFVAMQRQLGTESVISDKRRQAEGRAREFARKADTDALTGVLNRLGFNGAFAREFERARRYKQPLSVVILDLDHFKRVNDEHGHVAGDQVLLGVARLVETHVRESDVLARWGGEEFVVLAPMTQLHGAAQLAEKLRVQLEQTPLGPAGPVTASLGVAELLPGEGMEALLHRADEALYRVKNGGRNALACAPADPADADAPGSRPVRPGPATGPAYADTGFIPIDQEHRALSDALESFVKKVNAGKAAEIRLALEAIVARAEAHFAHEERLMEAFDYPLRQRHGENHALFVEDARRFLRELEESGLTLGFRRWAVGRLLEWFRLHILAHDVALGHFLTSAGATEPARPALVG